MLKKITFLLIIFSTLCRGNIDSTNKNAVHVDRIILERKQVFDNIDTFLISSTLLDREEDIFVPSFFSIGSGLYKFPFRLNLDDYDWISNHIMLTYEEVDFKKDTLPRLIAKYDHANNSGHWFTAEFDRMIGNSKLSAKLNRNSQSNLYPITSSEGSIGKKFNFLIGSEIPFKDEYILTLSYYRNQALIKDNGGYKNADSLLSNYEFADVYLSSNLSSASNFIFSQKVSIGQKIKLNSISKLNVESNFEENKYSFGLSKEDINSTFFSNSYLDTTETHDSIGFRKFVIKPSIELGKFSKKRLPILSFSLNKEINDKQILNNSYAQGKLNLLILNNPISIKGRYHFENTWKGNFSLQSKTRLIIKKELVDTVKHFSKIEINLNYRSELPSYLFMNYFSNHFRWKNNFDPVKKIHFCAKLNLKRFKSLINFNIQNISNYIYFNENSSPNQTNRNITAGELLIKKQISIKKFKLFSGLGLQFSSSKLIRVPTLYTRNNLVYEFKLRKVPFNIGSNFSFFNKYLGLNYNPAIRHYYLGNQFVGGTPVVDFFLVSRIGPADVYIKYENAFYNINKDLFVGENYPITFSLFRFGLKWILTN